MINTDLNLKFRYGLKNDINDIHQMLCELATETGYGDKMTSSHDDLIKFGFRKNPSYKILLAEKASEIVGLCLYFYTFSSWLGQMGIYVQDLYIKKHHRTDCIGVKLLKELVQLEREKEITHIRLTADENNSKAQKFYEKIGFILRDEEKTYHIDTNKLSSYVE